MGEIRFIVKRYIGPDENGNDMWYIEAAGPSTATKPTSGIITGSIFWERGTNGSWTVYWFDEGSGKWTDKEGNEG